MLLLTVLLVFISDFIVSGSEKWFLIYVKRRVMTRPDPEGSFLDQVDEIYEKYFYPISWGLLTFLTLIVGKFFSFLIHFKILNLNANRCALIEQIA